MPIEATWLNAVSETAIEPDLPIVDPHHHLWDYPSSRYLLDELLDDTGSGHNVVATVFVECGSKYRADGADALKPVGETEFVDAVARAAMARDTSGVKTPRVAAGIVGFADLTLGDAVESVLAAHLAASPQRFRGVRHAAGWHVSDDIRNSHSNPPSGLLALPTFRAGFAQLAKFNLTFDAWLFHTQIDELTDLARAFPDTTIVLDHFGGPLGIGPYAGRGDQVFEAWCRAIDALAACDNVVAKLGGINMTINGFDWHKRERPPTSQELVDATGRYYRRTIDKFGPQRCMFESNFPMDKLSCSYCVLWNSFKKLAASYSAAERAAMFHGTAARVYRLDLTG